MLEQSAKRMRYGTEGCAAGRLCTGPRAALQVWIEGSQSASASTDGIKGRAGAGRRPCCPPSAGGWMGREHLRCPATCAGGCGKRAAARGKGATWQWMCSACAGAGRRWGEAGPKAEHVLVWFSVPGQQQNGHVRPECGRGGLAAVLPRAASKWQAGVGKKSASSFYEYREWEQGWQRCMWQHTLWLRGCSSGWLGRRRQPTAALAAAKRASPSARRVTGQPARAAASRGGPVSRCGSAAERAVGCSLHSGIHGCPAGVAASAPPAAAGAAAKQGCRRAAWACAVKLGAHTGGHCGEDRQRRMLSKAGRQTMKWLPAGACG